MPMSAAERQARLRTRRAKAGAFGHSGERLVRIDMWIPSLAKVDLACLAVLHGTESLQAELTRILQMAADGARKADPEAWETALDQVLGKDKKQ